MVSLKKKLQPMGGSVAVILPKIWTESKGLGPHDTVELQLGDVLIIRPVKVDNES